MQAVILAGGVGSRLERAAGGKPKCLVEIGGKPLIEHQLEALADEGIGKVLIVTGYKSDEVQKIVGNRAEYIENTRYEETNSLYSLWLVRDWVKDPFVLMNGDLLFHPEILSRLLAQGGNALAFDSTSSKGKEQTKVAVREGVVIDLGKDLRPELARGESLGLLCFDLKGVHALFSRTHALIESGGEKSWVIEGVRAACSDVEVCAVNMAGLPWAELDFPADLERARNQVWPEIWGDRWKKVVAWRRTKWAAAALLMGGLIFAGWAASTRWVQNEPQWTNAAPQQAQRVLLELPRGRQRWCRSVKGKPVVTAVEGPTRLRVEIRLLMPEGTTEPGRYVAQVSLDGAVAAGETFKATPVKEASLRGFTVGDRDRIELDVPEGEHRVEVDLLSGTSDAFLTRIRFPETAYRENDDTEKE